MKNGYKFFSNDECKYFPCHKAPAAEDFNCLFCFCPLYHMDDKCGGIFHYTENENKKNCIDCHLPHMPEYYDVIISKMKAGC